MADLRDEITRIIEKAEKAAYRRGWLDCRDSILRAAGDAKPPEVVSEPSQQEPLGDFAVFKEPQGKQPRRGRPSGKAIDIVADCIASTPGMKGVDVVRAAQAIDATIPERTVRTCLRRLRENKVIWKRSGLWYPKPKQGAESANENGDAVGSHPH